MIPVIDTLQRITATALVAGFYLLPAALGGIMTDIEVELEAVTSPQRVAAYILELPAAASIPMLAQEEAEKKAEDNPKRTAPKDDMLAVNSGVPTATAAAKQSRLQQRRQNSTANSDNKRKGRKNQCMASSGQVTSTGNNRYQVERALLDHYFGNTDAAAKLGSATWYREDDGDIAGIRLRNVRCGSPIEEAGLKRGDIIRAANGKKVDSMAGVIALWWQLRSKDSVKLVITRDGQRKRLNYSLV